MKGMILKMIYGFVRKTTYANSVLALLIAILYLAFAFAATKTVRLYVEDLYYATAIAGGLWGSVISLIILSSKESMSRKKEYEPNIYIALVALLIVAIFLAYGWFATVE